MPWNGNSDAPARPAIFPPGLIGDVADFIYRAAPYPNATIALAGAIAFVAGIAGRAYNADGAGLNQYVLTLAPTGTGKEAVAEGIAHLMAAAFAKTPGIAEFRGPGELVSAPGLFKWLDRLTNPAMFCIIGEFGLMLKAMASPNANANMAGLQRVLLHLWSKSGRGNIFDASAYSDREKNTRAIKNPSLTIFGEGVPESFYSTLDVGMIASGLLPRVLLFETNDPKPYRNRNRQTEPSAALIEAVAALTAQCLTLAAADRAHNVGFDDAAAQTFDAFEKWATDQENAAKNDQTRGLWARLNLKALKLAALIAVGRDPFNPVVNQDDCMWATNLAVDQTNALLGKFERGEVGEDAGNEQKQQEIIVKIIREYMDEPDFEKVRGYGPTIEMHRDSVIPQSYLQRRTSQLPAFAQDRAAGGATRALHRTINNMLEADELREMPKAQMRERYNVQPRAFAIGFSERIRGTRLNPGGGV